MIVRAMLAAGTATDVVVPIVTAILGLIGGFLPAWYRARQQRLAQRRTYSRERANELAGRLGGAREAVRHALDGRSYGTLSEKAIDDANWLVGEVAGGLPSARLRLSPVAGDAAKGAVDGLRRAVQLLGDEDRSPEDARAAYEQASAAEDEFVRAVREELGQD